MTQVELALHAQAPHHDDSTGVRIGWDHAHRGLVPPPELLLDGTPIGQGWRAARAVFGGRSWPATRHTRQWLALRIEAWRARAPFDLQTVTPNHLAQIEVMQCPVTRLALSGAADSPSAARVARLNPQAAYAAGNLVMLSRAADQAWRGLTLDDLVRRARAEELAAALAGTPTGGIGSIGSVSDVSDMGDVGTTERNTAARGEPVVATIDAIGAAAWWRLVTLRSLATPLPAAQAARLPMAVLPPNRARVLNSVQALQALLSLRMASNDWCQQVAPVAARLPAHGLRVDFNLWVGAVAPRVLEAQALGQNLQRAVEDAWLGERVQRRWLHFVMGLGAPACDDFVQRLAAQPLPGRQARLLAPEQAVDGWALAAPDAALPRVSVGAPLPRQPAPPAVPRRTARTPCAPRPRATTARQPAAT